MILLSKGMFLWIKELIYAVGFIVRHVISEIFKMAAKMATKMVTEW